MVDFPLKFMHHKVSNVYIVDSILKVTIKSYMTEC
jgi:hypothetical protein